MTTLLGHPGMLRAKRKEGHLGAPLCQHACPATPRAANPAASLSFHPPIPFLKAALCHPSQNTPLWARVEGHRA